MECGVNGAPVGYLAQFPVPNYLLWSLSSSESAGKEPPESSSMVATSTLKTKSSDCVWEPVDRRYYPACIEKGGLTCRTLPPVLLSNQIDTT